MASVYKIEEEQILGSCGSSLKWVSVPSQTNSQVFKFFNQAAKIRVKGSIPIKLKIGMKETTSFSKSVFFTITPQLILYGVSLVCVTNQAVFFTETNPSSTS